MVNCRKRFHFLYLQEQLRTELEDGGREDWICAQDVLQLMEEESGNPEVGFADVIEAVKNCGNLQHSRRFLQQKCQVCLNRFPATKVRPIVSHFFIICFLVHK